MSTKEQKPTSGENTPAILQPAVESGDDSKEATAQIQTTSAPVRASVEVAVAPPSAVESLRRISFADAVPKFKEVGFDLEKAREKAVREHGQWGLIAALRKKGIIRSDDQYGALFDQATFTESGLTKLTARLQSGQDWLGAFDAQQLRAYELFQVLIQESGIPFWDDTYGYQNLGKQKNIDPGKIPGLMDLNREIRPEIHRAAFKDAYDATPDWQPGIARIPFTPNTLEVSTLNRSATKSAQLTMTEGTNFADFYTNLIRFRTQIDKGLQKVLGTEINIADLNQGDYQRHLQAAFRKGKINLYMPDKTRWTQSPLDVYEDGSVAGLIWYSSVCKGAVGSLYPESAGPLGGQRDALV